MYVKGLDYIEKNEELGINLQAARQRCDLTQEVVSKAVNTERSNIAYFESGKVTPDIFTLIRLSSVYGMEPRDLILRESQTNKEKDKIYLARLETLSIINTLYLLDVDIYSSCMYILDECNKEIYKESKIYKNCILNSLRDREKNNRKKRPLK